MLKPAETARAGKLEGWRNEVLVLGVGRASSDGCRRLADHQGQLLGAKYAEDERLLSRRASLESD